VRDKEVFMKKFFVLSSWSRIAAIGSIFMCAFLAACGDDDSWSPSDADSSRSSSVIQSGDSHEGSCSSNVSVIPGSDPESSSAEKQGSSSSSSVILSSSEGSSDSRSGDSKSSSSKAKFPCEEEGKISKRDGVRSICQDGYWTSLIFLPSADSSVTLVPPCRDSCEYGTLFDDRDGKTYKTVKIGTQWWMAENLNLYMDEFSNEPFDGQSGCLFDNPAYCDEYGYGRYYLWSMAMDSAAFFSDDGKGCGSGVVCNPQKNSRVQGLCPAGWHLPSADEWNILYLATGERAEHLRASHDWQYYPNGPSVFSICDIYGFGALPGNEDRTRVNFLTSYEIDEKYSAGVSISYSGMRVYIDWDYKSYGFIRCIKD
jgi:uncharacterized protein (TIGR02145 family)